MMVSNVLAPGETVKQQLPYGHQKLIAAVCYQITGMVPTEEELLKPYRRLNGDPVFFENDTQTNLLCLAFYEKYLYEGTHAQNNVAFHRRYVDVSNPEAIAEFINNTYRPYTEVLGDFYARRIGDEAEKAVVEAIFSSCCVICISRESICCSPNRILYGILPSRPDWCAVSQNFTDVSM